tara:strand:+ start:731 stop:2686 length:1956 start_codon:yes stop_codon:yes gene_type:complete
MATDQSVPPKVELSIIRKAILSRKVEERLLELFFENKLFGTVHTCIGQEFSGAVITEFLVPGDAVFSNHRCHGHFLSFTNDPAGLIAEIMGKETGVCAGRGGSQHICKSNFFSNGIQGGIVPISAGLAFARKLDGNNYITAVFIGDGTLGEGALYETLNIVAKWEIPLLIVLENNGYAQSTKQDEVFSGDISMRAEAVGIKTAKGDTWNWKGLYHIARDLINFIRTKSKPGFLQIDTYRLKAHSTGDEIRGKKEMGYYEKRDPLNLLLQENKEENKELLKEINKTIEDSVAFAEKSNYPSLNKKKNSSGSLWKGQVFKKRRVVKAINESFKKLMGQYPKMLFIGEDIKSPYGGAFKVTKGLSKLFPNRVFNAPISEAAIVGLGSGLAMGGYRPFIEIMFGDFMTLTMDQILNHASKFEYMYNNQVSVNLVVRTPMGGGRGFGPTHSQTLDRHFFGIPGLRVIAINNLIEPHKVFSAIMKNNTGPTIVIENKILYTVDLREHLPHGFKAHATDEDFSVIHIKPDASAVDLTLMGYGGIAETLIKVVERLFEEYDLVAEIICPTQIYPFNINPLSHIFKRSRALFLVEEGQGFAGFGAEIIAQIAESNPGLLKKVKRIIPPSIPIPASGHLEQAVLPGIDNIIKNVMEVISEV